ncbi:MAG: SulP family inorganic anion transporter [Ottowia sp.]|nr:SulP family inorganic anion transporter [Ottowia sp.]
MLQFRPKLIDSFAGYNRQRFLADLGAGVTVAVVALPLAMAFAIASGLKPEAGLFTAIIGGLIISLLGGSKVQIGGPAGAFIVIVYGIVLDHGVSGLIVATIMSGMLLFAMGLLRLGTLVRYIPTSVIVGFTNGIAVLIAFTQVKDFLGLTIADMPGDFFGVIAALWRHRESFNGWAFGLATASLAVLVLWQNGLPALGRRMPAHRGWLARVAGIPGTIVALVLAMLAVSLFELPVETIGSRFGGIPSSLPHWSWPSLDWASTRVLLMPAITLALLGAIESLLCARVADDIIKDRHDPNQELMAQGIANFVAPLLAGMPATGTIARTVTGVNAGANTPVAGTIHALALLVVVLVAAPLAASIPLATLAAILMFVAWNMGEWRAFAHVRRMTLPYGTTLLAVFGLTVVFDLTVAVQFGIFAAIVTFIYRIARMSGAEPVQLPPRQDVANDISAWRLHGAIFFGATTIADRLLKNLPSRVLVLDFEHVLYMDSTGADALNTVIAECAEQGVAVLCSALGAQPLDMARRTGMLARLGHPPAASLEQALATARSELAEAGHAARGTGAGKP